jgi:hypothetical protein
MNRPLFIAVAGLAAATWSMGVPESASAQPAPAASKPAASPAPNAAPESPSAAQAPTNGPPMPVMLVTSVEVLHSDRAGGMDIVRARGLVSSSEWDEPHLLPINHGDPVDGVLNLIFQANPPTGIVPLGPFMVVEALLPIENGHPYKGIIVRSGTNAIPVKTLPGYAEIAPPKEDCSKCIGKYFQAKGAAPPAGVGASDIVREEDLPYALRVIRPTDGIPNYIVDPNRLTLVLSEDGRIADAAWD